MEIHTDEHRDYIKFEISTETLTAIRKGECPTNIWTKKMTPQEFMEQVATLCEEELHRNSEYDRALRRLELLLESNTQLGIVKAIRVHRLRTQDAMLLLRICVAHVILEEEEVSMNDMPETRHRHHRTRAEIRNGKHPLQEMGLLEHANHNGFAQRDTICLTEDAKNKLLAEYENLLVGKTIPGLMEAATIVEKPLFYPEKTHRGIRELTDLLQAENWHRVRESLVENGMRTGFACLFFGGPGTGKTESAKQIAKMTGRAIMQLDISDTKSCWFGESEKKIKAIFNRYRTAVKCSAVTPIFLFNEADAVIGKRQELGTTRNGPGQTENAIQNIILQEIENLDGILIATTNLNVNMDSAFERRFLYKIEFEKPTVDARKSIWQAMIPDLQDGDIAVLAERFEFSGGQIENISRRRTVASVLHGKPPSLEELIAYCREEQTGGDNAKRIGFSML
jgi:SpoVK/Ycf46/Vps4 family AAA+-type ATPase